MQVIVKGLMERFLYIKKYFIQFYDEFKLIVFFI